MVRRAGSADLKLRGDHIPVWIAQRMTRLGAVIVEAVVLEYGRDAWLRHLVHPFYYPVTVILTGWPGAALTAADR